MNELLKAKSHILNLGFSETYLPVLDEYFQALVAANEDLNLFSRQMSLQELVDNHFIDCLLPLSYFPESVKHVADFGSGGGLPAIIYAIQFPHRRFTLYEKSPKKQDFLKSLKFLVKNIDVQGQIPLELPKVDLITARGFKPIDVILDVSRHYYENGGKYFLLKGKAEKIEEELTLARKKFKKINPQIKKLNSPVLEVERHLVLL